MLNYPPLPGVFFELDSGGTVRAELAGNRAATTLRNPTFTGPYFSLVDGQAVDGGVVGKHTAFNIHNGNTNPGATLPLNRTMFGGTAIAISYTSDEKTVQPTDFTVISINRMSPWTRLAAYDIPADMPPCPPAGCLCSWSWIHTRRFGEGNPNESYNTLFRCSESTYTHVHPLETSH
jgi:hypothetical protein